jgi:hypothetical protein
MIVAVISSGNRPGCSGSNKTQEKRILEQGKEENREGERKKKENLAGEK